MSTNFPTSMLKYQEMTKPCRAKISHKSVKGMEMAGTIKQLIQLAYTLVSQAYGHRLNSVVRGLMGGGWAVTYGIPRDPCGSSGGGAAPHAAEPSQSPGNHLPQRPTEMGPPGYQSPHRPPSAECSFSYKEVKEEVEREARNKTNVPPPPVSNEHCVQRTLPVRTVFFVYLINSVHN